MGTVEEGYFGCNLDVTDRIQKLHFERDEFLDAVGRRVFFNLCGNAFRGSAAMKISN